MTNIGSTKVKTIMERILLLYIPLVIFLSFIILPFVWTGIMSLKREGDILKKPIKYIPDPATFDNFISAWNRVGFSQYFLNSFLIAISVVSILIVFSILVGYPLSRFQFKGKNAFLLLLLCTQFLPHAMLLIPLFMTFRFLHLINSPVSLVLTYLAFQLPFNSILMTGFMSNVPIEIEEAAMIDGCGRIKSLFRVILPILLPGVVAAGSFAFISSWKEFLFALMFINDPKKMTIPVGLSYMMGQYNVDYGSLAAGSIIAIIPPILLFAYVQKYLVHGMAGAVKG